MPIDATDPPQMSDVFRVLMHAIKLRDELANRERSRVDSVFGSDTNATLPDHDLETFEQEEH